MKHILLALFLAFVLSGGPISMVEEEAMFMQHWTIPVNDNCTVDMPHGLKRCYYENVASRAY